MQKEGYRPLTIVSHSSILRHLAKNCNLRDPEAIKLYLSEKNVSPARKERVANAYLKYARSRSITFTKPRYETEDKLPFVPLQNEIESILEFCKSLRHATYLRLLYETAMRAGEGSRLQPKDFDFEKRTVRIIPEKRGRAREVRLSEKLCAMLMQVFAKYPDAPFPRPEVARKHLERTRKKLSKIACNTRLLQIHLHTLRHFRATALYHQTKDLLFVKEFLGHRSLTNTLKYTRLVDWKSDDFVCKAAKSLSEATSLIEAGFEYVTELDGAKLFRKRT